MSDFAGRWSAGRIAETRFDNVVLEITEAPGDLRATLDFVDRESGLTSLQGAGRADGGLLTLDFPEHPQTEPPEEALAKLSGLLQHDGRLTCLWISSSQAISFTLSRGLGAGIADFTTSPSMVDVAATARGAVPPTPASTPTNGAHLPFLFTCAIACGFASCMLGALRSNRLVGSDEGPPSALAMSLALFGPPLTGGLVTALVLVAGWPSAGAGTASGSPGGARRNKAILFVVMTAAVAAAFWTIARSFFGRGGQY
jgi:hypothetical protein